MKIDINKILEEKKISQSQLADDLGVSQATISRWKKGKNQPLLQDVVKLSNYLETQCLTNYIIEN